jgi:lipid II:glycine glycyltransferase (peptidoglycan interpeptide bridge formation enzyme)
MWRAMRLARDRGSACFDHGAVTVTDDHTHPHHSVYEFKRRFGGRLEALLSGELVLSRVKHAFQQRVLMPAWRRLHPLYVRVTSATATAPAGW